MIFPNFTEYSYETHDKETIFYQTNFHLVPDKNKRVLLLNYGLVCSNHHWREQVAFFQEDFNIVLSDYRGHYKSTGLSNLKQITFKNICIDLNGILETLQVEKIVVAGHSMGVNVSLEFQKMFPQKVEKLILISGSAIPVYNTMFNSNIIDQVIPHILKVNKLFPKAIESFWKYVKFNPIIRKLVHAGGFNLEQVSSEFIEIYLSKLSELGPTLFFQLLEQMNMHSIIAHLEQIEVPVLIIGGDDDKVIPHKNQRVFEEKIKNSEIFIVHKGSHVPQIDFPTMINERISLFIQ